MRPSRNMAGATIMDKLQNSTTRKRYSVNEEVVAKRSNWCLDGSDKENYYERVSCDQGDLTTTKLRTT